MHGRRAGGILRRAARMGGDTRSARAPREDGGGTAYRRFDAGGAGLRGRVQHNDVRLSGSDPEAVLFKARDPDVSQRDLPLPRRKARGDWRGNGFPADDGDLDRAAGAGEPPAVSEPVAAVHAMGEVRGDPAAVPGRARLGGPANARTGAARPLRRGAGCEDAFGERAPAGAGGLRRGRAPGAGEGAAGRASVQDVGDATAGGAIAAAAGADALGAGGVGGGGGGPAGGAGKGG